MSYKYKIQQYFCSANICKNTARSKPVNELLCAAYPVSFIKYTFELKQYKCHLKLQAYKKKKKTSAMGREDFFLFVYSEHSEPSTTFSEQWTEITSAQHAALSKYVRLWIINKCFRNFIDLFTTQ